MKIARLEDILSEIQVQVSSSKQVLCIFDLDSTLFDLTDRKQEILNEFFKREGSRAEFEVLNSAKVNKNEFGIEQALLRVGIEKSSNIYKEVSVFFHQFFFHNDFLRFDKAIAGSVEFVKNVFDLGSHIIYLTGRDEPRMLSGTLESLMAVGFPMGSEKIEVCLKPHARIDDHQFKLAFMQNLYKARQYDQVWLFENEPVNINLITKHFPETRVVFIDTNHCGQENVAAHHFKIKNFL